METLSEQQAVGDGACLHGQRPARVHGETCAWCVMKTVGPPYSGKLHVRWDGKGMVNRLGEGECGTAMGKPAATARPCLRSLSHSFTLDFVVIHKDLGVVQEAEKYIAEWVGKMGLQLKPEKTRTVHSLLRHEGHEPGFNFLGFNCRQYRRTPQGKIKTLIKPEKDKLHSHLQELGMIIRAMGKDSQRALISKSNPKIVGWSNYYRTCAAAVTFKKADNVVYWQLSTWAKKIRPTRSIRRKLRKYFRVVKNSGSLQPLKEKN
jgi:hypothetical protein